MPFAQSRMILHYHIFHTHALNPLSSKCRVFGKAKQGPSTRNFRWRGTFPISNTTSTILQAIISVTMSPILSSYASFLFQYWPKLADIVLRDENQWSHMTSQRLDKFSETTTNENCTAEEIPNRNVNNSETNSNFQKMISRSCFSSQIAYNTIKVN